MDIPSEPTHIVSYYCGLMGKTVSDRAYYGNGSWHTFDTNRAISAEFGDIIFGKCELFFVSENKSHLCEEFPYAAQLISGEQRGDFKTYEDCKSFCDWRNHANQTGHNCRLEEYITNCSPTNE